MQKGSAYEQLQAGVRIFHTKYNSSWTTDNCAVFSTLGDLQGFPLLGNLSHHLNDMARFLQATKNEFLLLVLDDLHLKYPDPCLIPNPSTK